MFDCEQLFFRCFSCLQSQWEQDRRISNCFCIKVEQISGGGMFSFFKQVWGSWMHLEAVFVCELSKLQQPGGIPAPGHGHQSTQRGGLQSSPWPSHRLSLKEESSNFFHSLMRLSLKEESSIFFHSLMAHLITFIYTIPIWMNDAFN